jgi:hypothetical protein
MAAQRPHTELSPPAESPNKYAPLALELDLDNDTNIPDPTAPGVEIGRLKNMTSAMTPGNDVNIGASSFDLLRYARNTTNSIQELKGLFASMDRDHKQDIKMAYASIQAMLNQFTPSILSNRVAVVACNKTIGELPAQVVNAVLPKMTASIHSARDNLSMTMASTMTSASNIFGTKNGQDYSLPQQICHGEGLTDNLHHCLYIRSPPPPDYSSIEFIGSQGCCTECHRTPQGP